MTHFVREQLRIEGQRALRDNAAPHRADVLPTIGANDGAKERAHVDALGRGGSSGPLDQFRPPSSGSVVISDALVQMEPAEDLRAREIKRSMGIIPEVANHVPLGTGVVHRKHIQVALLGKRFVVAIRELTKNNGPWSVHLILRFSIFGEFGPSGSALKGRANRVRQGNWRGCGRTRLMFLVAWCHGKSKGQSASTLLHCRCIVNSQI